MLKIFWGFIAVVGLTTVAWGFQTALIQPREEQIEILSEELMALENQIDATLKAFPDLEKPKADLKKQEAELIQLREKVASWKAKVLSASQLNTLLMGEVERENEETFSPYARARFEINTADSFEKIKAYINSLEKSSPFLNLLKLRLTPDEQTPGLLQTELTAQITHSE